VYPKNTVKILTSYLITISRLKQNLSCVNEILNDWIGDFNNVPRYYKVNIHKNFDAA